MDYEKIYTQLLLQRDLTSTFPPLREKARLLGDWSIADDVERQWTTYQQMMQFATRGVKDPEAKKMRDRIIDRLLMLAQRMERHERVAVHKEQRYVSKCREMQRVSSLESIATSLRIISSEIVQVKNDDVLREAVKTYNLDKLYSEHELTLVRLFNWLWTCEPWTSNDASIVSDLLFSDSISSDDKAVVISAVTLSLMEYPDRAKLLLLLDCYLSDDAQVVQRALVGAVLALYRNHGTFYHDFAELNDRLAAYREDPAFVGDLYMVMTLLQASSVTDKVTSKMRDDIMPAIMQARFAKQQKVDPEQLNKHGENPEWMDDERATKKMQEMAELQMSGADIHYSSFAHMKGGSFFGEMAHWFYPFSIDNPNVPEIKKLLSSKIGNITRLMLKGSPFCNSDKYSLCFTLSSIGQFGEDMVEQQMQQQLPEGENIDDMLNDAEKMRLTKRDTCRHYIFDLYRFYFSYSLRSQFYNPFAALRQNAITPDFCSVFADVTAGHEDETAQYADFLMRNEFYAEAAQMFRTLVKGNEFDPALAVMWQKLGFCYQHLGEDNYDKALHAYTVADSLKQNSKWTILHIISLCEELHATDMMVEYCKRLVDLEPDSAKSLLKCANAMAMLKHDYASALPLLHKANYLDEQSEPVRLLLALCLIMTGERDKAIQHVLNLMPSERYGGEAQILYAMVLLADDNAQEAYITLRNLTDEARQTDMYALFLDEAVPQGLIDSTTLQLFSDAALLM